MSEVTLDMILAEMTRMNLQTQQGFRDVHARLDKMDARIDKIEARLDKIEARLDKIEARLDGMDARLDGMAKDIKVNRQQTVQITERVVSLEESRDANPGHPHPGKA